MPHETSPAAASDEQFPVAKELRDPGEKESRSRILLVFGVVLLLIAAIVALVSFVNRPKPKAAGKIEEAYAVAPARRQCSGYHQVKL